ncbi:FAD-linked oxidase C-terminal domain-containing protein [Neorhizobium sp. NPDC001467]|uniref:FAD-linked oxidase C-terminal domain-containing protein n=1 Tax=Neorhizobium sp. NPDC001467 TaxID=3390595 RepID=UPI003D018ADD
MLAIRTIVNECADVLGGSFSAEHGIGRESIDELRTRTDQTGHQSMQRLKRAFDPHGIRNPGCVLSEQDQVS